MTDFNETQLCAEPVARLNERIRDATADCFVDILKRVGFKEPEKLKPKFVEILESQP